MTPAIASTAPTRALATAWTAVAMAALAIFMFVRGDIALIDPDTQWHIAAGRLMWETGAMPRVDTMSFTYAGKPWIAKEWLSQVILFAAWSIGGWLGVFTLTALSLAAAAGVVAWRLFNGLAPFVAVAVMWVVVNSLLGIGVARPHALALPVMALFILMLLNAAERDQSPPWLALPLITLWANLHAAFTLGFIIAAFLALDAILRAPAERRVRLVLLWGVFGLGCVAAACVHPYGAQPLLINIDMARGNESVALITEWNRHDIFGPTGYRVVVPALIVATLAIGWRENAARLLLGAFAVYLTWKHQRFIMLLAVVAPMIGRDTLDAALRAFAARIQAFQGPDPLRDPKWRTPALTGCLAAFLALPFAVERPKPPAIIAPTAALQAVPRELLSQPLYNSYNLGGFLILNGVRTFIDGRTDQLFTNNFMARMIGHIKAGDREGFLDFIDAQGARWAIAQQGFDDLKLIESSPRWREIYGDEHAKVFVRVGG